MNESRQTTRDTLETAPERKAMKPYRKPEVRYERVFETMAMSCGKVQVTQGSCHFNRKAS